MDILQPQHTNRQYEEDLRAVRGSLLKMGGLVERQIAEYEQKLRDQLLREHEFAELAAAQREQAATKRFLPVIGGAGSAPREEVHV